VLGTTRILTFLTVKVLEYRGKEAELEADPNPVGLFVVAHLEGLRLEKDKPELAKVKQRLILNMRRRGMTPQEVGQWHIYFDWLMRLDDRYDERMMEEVARVEGVAVPSLSYLERRGRRQGFLKAAQIGLKLKFGADGMALLPEVEKVEDLAALEAICDAIEPAASLDDVRKLIPASEQVRQG
jgi:hypothetical protein